MLAISRKAVRRRDHDGIVAREKYSAFPSSAVTTLTAFGLSILHVPGSAPPAWPPAPRAAQRSPSSGAEKVRRQRRLVALDVDVDVRVDLPRHLAHAVRPAGATGRRHRDRNPAFAASGGHFVGVRRHHHRVHQPAAGRRAPHPLHHRAGRRSRAALCAAAASKPSRAGITPAIRNLLMQASLQEWGAYLVGEANAIRLKCRNPGWYR